MTLRSEIYLRNSQKLIYFISTFKQKTTFYGALETTVWVRAHVIPAWLIDDSSHLFKIISYEYFTIKSTAIL